MDSDELNYEIYDAWDDEIKILSIYEVSRPEKSRDYNVFNKFTICCDSEFTARNTHPEGYVVDHEERKWYVPVENGVKAYARRKILHRWIASDYTSNLVVKRIKPAEEGAKEGVLTTDVPRDNYPINKTYFMFKTD